MTNIVILKPPGGSSGWIYLNAERVDYTINNEIQQKRAGTEDGRVAQMISGLIQITITGICIEENGKTAQQNADELEHITNTWGSDSKPSSPGEYPLINWRIGDERMLIQKLTLTEEGWMDGNEISFLLTVYVDTRQ